MNTIDESTLAEMTIRMLERTAMVLAEPAAKDARHPEATRFAQIRYRGPSQGMLVLGATEGFLRELAASLLGVDTTDVNVDTHGSDALKEMANIVGGSMILALSGDVCEYSLGLPELVLRDPGAIARNGAMTNAECIVVTEGGPLRVHWGDECTAKAA